MELFSHSFMRDKHQRDRYQAGHGGGSKRCNSAADYLDQEATIV